MNDTEARVISAVLKDKQIHVLLQANVESILRTHNDIWNFIRNYSEQNSVVPPVDIVIEKFRDFRPVESVGATKHHLEELQQEYLNDSLKDLLRTAAADVQGGHGGEAWSSLLQKPLSLKRILLQSETLTQQM
jgi:hypothetical protein